LIQIFTCASRAACESELGCPEKKKYQAIIFMDEFDAIGPDRSDDPTGLAANSVNTLLQMMDGIKSKPNVAVIAATTNQAPTRAAAHRACLSPQ
jgi:SpoVK/Ycf46/Vps4 family AAA+-type ATPase